MIVFFSTFFMFMAGLLCLVGLFSRHYKENLLQTVAMCCGVLGCWSRVPDIWVRTDIPFDWFLVHACLGLFAIGTAVQVLYERHKEKFARLQAALDARVHGWHPQPVGLAPHRRRDDA